MINNWPTWLPIRDDLSDLSPYGAPQIAGLVQLNTNENPFMLPVAVSTAISQRISEIVATLNRYPDRDASVLRSKLASYVNGLSGTAIDASNVWVANGSNEILQTIFLACGGAGRTALGFTPSYSVHPLVAKITGTTWISGMRDAEFAIDIPAALKQILEVRPSMIFVTTPNNPSGTSTPIADIEEIARVAVEIRALLIVDEAYIEFSDEKSAITLLSKFPNLVITRTMSKAFAFAGARVGYFIGHPNLVDAALITRLPYHLSTLTQAAAEVAVEHAELMQQGIQSIIRERARVEFGLRAVGWFALPSSANFLMFAGFDDESKNLWQKFLDRGVLIRDIGIAGFLRVTIGTESENDRFLAVMQELAS